MVNKPKWQWHPALSLTFAARKVTAIRWEQTFGMPEGTEKKWPPNVKHSDGRGDASLPYSFKPLCKGDSTFVLRLYQRDGVQLFSISTGNGTKQLP